MKKILSKNKHKKALGWRTCILGNLTHVLTYLFSKSQLENKTPSMPYIYLLDGLCSI